MKKERLLLAVTIIMALILVYQNIPRPLNYMAAKGIWASSLDEELLDLSIGQFTTFITNQQKRAGNFNYEYNWKDRSQSTEDNEVRQAGAFWALGLIYLDHSGRLSPKHFDRSYQFFLNNSRKAKGGGMYITYPGSQTGKIGTVALSSLALIEFLRENERIADDRKQELMKTLYSYLTFLKRARRSDGLWPESYEIATGLSFGAPSPYFNGEILLAIVKAYKYHGYSELRDILIESCEATWRIHVEEALRKDPDSSETKGFYQWASMTYYEMGTSELSNNAPYLERVIELADWMIDIHKTLERRGNTGYAYEGICHAYSAAVILGDKKHQDKFRYTTARGLKKLTSWQVGSPIANSFVRKAPFGDPGSFGGVQSSARNPVLRIDTAQHQLHAMMLARKYIFGSTTEDPVERAAE